MHLAFKGWGLQLKNANGNLLGTWKLRNISKGNCLGEGLDPHTTSQAPALPLDLRSGALVTKAPTLVGSWDISRLSGPSPHDSVQKAGIKEGGHY